ncbi:MAG: hypothetical protein M1429_03100 [Patescibacteria group bacterium]|nr:hypothetical protein [Patescibacteria group bacterium]
MKKLVLVAAVLLAVCAIVIGCGEEDSSDKTQREQQEKILAEGTSQVGMPGIKNFRERKIMKDILELRDQEGLITYTYLENEIPKTVHRKTALAGKLTYFGETIGYGIPYATQFTSPQKPLNPNWDHETAVVPQADPNGLFSPGSAEGTWVLMKDPNSDKTLPIYIEPRIVVSPFKLPMD